ncbi:unnamed protein product [Adineta ricciae]|uniref:U-box domain-containing protein n=1 Tax=Adineta ricciae TaxID=249248 RepID=A0A815V349_ADIRI|nr:unnamed protein product [Adineta ricciae]CAF1527846.1 unnamed protein product [Adineta ricciae]
MQISHDLICPITLDVCRDPVLAADGHIYERSAIVQWIKQQGTSPLTRKPLTLDDLHSETSLKQQNLFEKSNIDQLNVFALSPSSLSITINPEEQMSTKQCGTIKRILVISSVVFMIIGMFICFFFITIHLTSTISSPSYPPTNHTDGLTTYRLPNNCTLANILPLFSWDNAQKFDYTYYSKTFQAMSTETIIIFAFRNDPSYWCLDSVSVVDISSNHELLVNGNFEHNPSNGFLRCNFYGNSSTNLFITSGHAYSGFHSFCDGSVGQPDYLVQKFHTKIGHSHFLSFWLQNLDDLSNSARVFLSY